MPGIHVDGILTAGAKSVSDVVGDARNECFPTKKLGELSWCMSSEYTRDSRVKGIFEISAKPRFVCSLLDRFQVSKTRPIHAFPPLELRSVDVMEAVVDVPFREVVRA